MTNASENPAKTLLHACCGPCSLEPVRLLRSEGHDLTVFYANSNIHPAGEYAHRLGTLRSWAETCDVPVVEGSYEPEAWEATAGRIGAAEPGSPQRKARCRACYRLRFEEAARFAAENGYARLATTLSVSPYQYTAVICEELERAATAAGLEPAFRDFRPFYNEATRRSREMGMYRQNYCGCRFSQAEAEAERAERKRQRQAEREAYVAAHAEERAAEEAARAAKRAERAAYEEKQRRKHAALKALREQPPTQ